MRYLASLQGEFGLGSNQGSTLRELVLTKAMRQLHLKSLVEPGTAGCGDQRVRAGDYWNDSIYSRQSGPPAVSEEFGPVDSSHKPLAKLTKTIQSARNDVDHCGLKDTPRKAESLAREFANVLSKL